MPTQMQQGSMQEQTGCWAPAENAKKAAYWAVVIASVLARPVEVILRMRFGSRYLGMASFLALFAVPMWMLLWPGESATGMLGLEGLFVVMQLRARVEQLRMGPQGDVVHTRYNGWPRLAAVFRRMDERAIKGAVEPMAVIVTGIVIMAVSKPLGSYLCVAGLALGVLASVVRSVERARVLEMNDALIEHQNTMEMFRAMSRDRFNN